MYPSHLSLYYNQPFSQQAYIYSLPYQEMDYYHSPFDKKQIGGHQPPSAPPGQDLEPGPPTSPPPSTVPQQSHQAGAYAVEKAV